MNKKGNIITIAVLALFVMVIIVGAFFITLGSGIITFASGTVNEITGSLGMAGDANLSAISDVSIGTLDTTLQMLQWGSGIILVFGLLGIIIFASAIRFRPSGFLIGMYLLMMIILIFTSIYMSNTYETFLDGSDDIATELKQMGMASFIMLYMPGIITMMGFIGGVIIFSGMGDDMV